MYKISRNIKINNNCAKKIQKFKAIEKKNGKIKKIYKNKKYKWLNMKTHFTFLINNEVFSSNKLAKLKKR